MVREPQLKSEDPGFDSRAGQGGGTVVLYLRVYSCADFFVPEPFVCTARTQIWAHVNHPISIGRKRVGFIAGGVETQKHCTQEGGGGGGGALDSAVLLPG